MLQSNTIALSRSTPMIVFLNGGSSIDLGLVYSGNYDNGDLIVNGILHLRVDNCKSLSLYYRDNNSNLVLIDNATPTTTGVYFDISRYLFLYRYDLSNLVLLNTASSGNNSKLYGSGHNLDINYHPAGSFYKTDCVVSNSINDTTNFKYDYFKREFLIKKDIYKGLLKIDLSIVFSNKMSQTSYWRFPVGWKIDFLNYLVLDLSYNPTCFVDGSNVLHKLAQVVGSNEYFYSIDGSKLIFKKIIENNITFFEQTSDITNEYWKYDSSGNLIMFIDRNHNVFNVIWSFSNVTIEDEYNNTISIIYYGKQNNIKIKLNNTHEYVLNMESSLDPCLVSISHGAEEDSIEYWTNGNILTYNTHDDYLLTNYFANNEISSIKYQRNMHIIEELMFEYDFLKTIITNKHNVKTFIYLDSNLKKMSEGEIIDGVEEKCLFYKSSNMLVDDLGVSFSNPIGRIYKNNGGSTTINFSSDGTYGSYSNYDGNLSLITANKRYILMASLKRTATLPLNENRLIKVQLYNDNNLIKTLEFDSHFKNQTVAVDFVAPVTETSNSIYQIKIVLEGMSSIGNITISNIGVIEFKGKKDTFFMNGQSDIIFDDLSTTPYYFDGINWYQFLSAHDLSGNVYSFGDLLTNFINVSKGKQLFWSDVGTKLTYNSNNPLSKKSGYVIRGHRNIQTSNAVFARKTWIKNYDENNVIKEIFEFSYLFESNGEYIFKTIKSIGGDVSETVKTYNDIFALIEDRTDELFTEYSYLIKTGNIKTKLLLSEKEKNDNDNYYIEKTHSYDNDFRISSSNELVDDDIETVSYIYDDDLEIVSSLIDHASVSELYSYDSYHEHLTLISKSGKLINRTFPSTSTSIFYNDSYFRIEQIDNADMSTFSIKYRNGYTEDYGNVTTFQKASDNTHDYLITTIYCVDRFRNVFDKYGRLYSLQKETQYGYGSFANFYYFDLKPQTLETLNTIFDIEDYISQNNPSITGSSKLYKIISNQIYEFDYLTNGSISSVVTKKNNASSFSTIEYFYDFLDRLSSAQYSFGNFTITKSLTYIDKFHSDVSDIAYSKTNINIHQLVQRDNLQRVSRTASSIDSSSSNYYIRLFNYKYSGNATNGLAKKIDEYSGTSTINSQHLNSTHVSYDEKGNIVSLMNGTSTTPDANSGVRYFYDDNNQLIKEKNYDLNKTIIYTYDSNGNVAFVTTKTLNEMSIISTESYLYHQYYKDLLTSFNGKSIMYDDSFNPIQIGNNIYLTWSMNRQLSIYTKNNVATNFEYNYEGTRIIKSNSLTGTHEYFLEGTQIVGERITDSNNSVSLLTFLYGIDGIIGFIKDGQYYYYRKNIFGDITAIYNGSTLVAYYKYDAYGNHKVYGPTDSEITDLTHIGQVNPFRYRGYYYDVETGLYYCQTRYYSPEMRRWLSLDDFQYFDSETIFGTNLFAYCSNNPVMNVDPDGHVIVSLLIAGFVFGAMIAATASIVTQGLQNGFENINWWQVLLDTAIGGVSGLVSFSGLGAIGSGLIGAALGFAGSALGDYISTGSFDEIDWTKAAFMATTGFMIGCLSNGGVQNKVNLIDSISKSSSAYRGLLTTISKQSLTNKGVGIAINFYSNAIVKDVSKIFLSKSNEAILFLIISSTMPLIYEKIFKGLLDK